MILIEDLISTGKSSLKAVDFLKEDGAEVVGVMSLFNYNFPQTIELFKHHDLPLYSICTLDDLLNISKEHKLLSHTETEKVLLWRNQTKI